MEALLSHPDASDTFRRVFGLGGREGTEQAKEHIAQTNAELRDRIKNIAPRTDDDLQDEEIHLERLRIREEHAEKKRQEAVQLKLQNSLMKARGDIGEIWGRCRGDIGVATAAELLAALGMQAREM